MSLNRNPKRRSGTNRLHFDLRIDNREAEVNLPKIGATRHPQTYKPDDDFIVLEDPDGSLFCVVQKGNNESRISWTWQLNEDPTCVGAAAYRSWFCAPDLQT